MNDRFEPPYQYVVLHRSCARDAGVAAAQTSHAVRGSMRDPAHPETHVCILRAETSDEIRALGELLAEKGLFCHVVEEPDPPYCGAAVALGVEPMPRGLIAPHMAHLKVFRGEAKPRSAHPGVAQVERLAQKAERSA